MVTNKKRLCARWKFLLPVVLAASLAGCRPSGPRSLLAGKRLIEQGNYAEAVAELKVASSLLSTNANAWNYLGIAYHHAGQPANAVEAYRAALKLNPDLIIVHYNLGCLLLEQNRPDTLEAAQNELTAYAVRQGNSVDGWLKAGTAQLRRGELTAAEGSFKEALRLNPQNVEALNNLGLCQLQRKRSRDAVIYFNNALKAQPNYAPALLNLAIAQYYLNTRPVALQKYKDYLALTPRPANWDAVNAAMQQLDLELNPPARPATNTIAINPLATNSPATNVASRPVAQPTNNSHPEVVSLTPKPTNSPSIKSNNPADTSPRPDSTKIASNPNPASSTPQNTVPANHPSAPTPTNDPASFVDEGPSPPTDTKPSKRGFFQRINPLSLFHRDPKSDTKAIASNSSSPGPANPVRLTPPDSGVISEAAPVSSQPASEARYPYLSPTLPASGNRAEADPWMAKGKTAQAERRFKDAEIYFRSATLADPAYFDAQYSLGSASYQAGDLGQSLRAYEMALAITPASFDAQFSFGLALKKANYLHDAAEQLERLLVSNPNETPAHLAAVHLTLGNLYAEQYHQVAPARAHYLKVLELDPRNSQATAIRYWLQNNS